MIIENKGYCYTCDQKVVFSSQQAWLRDWYKCSNCGSIVTRDWGYDICDFILKHSGLYTTIVYIDDISLGIRAEYIEVLISRKI